MTKMAKDNIGPTVIVVVTQYCDWQHRHKKISTNKYANKANN